MAQIISLSVSKLCKTFKNNQIFDNAEMSAKTGDIIALVGENGCGKSTLLNMLSGVSKPDSGDIIFSLDEKTLGARDLGEFVSYVPQNNYLLNDLSAYDNLLFWYRGDKEKLDNDLECGLIKALDISGFLKRRVSKLSVGMQKRIALACALANSPRVLLLDEVNAPLDIVCRLRIRELLSEYAKAGNIIILSTHDEGDIEISNKIYYINESKINSVESSSLFEIFGDKL